MNKVFLFSLLIIIINLSLVSATEYLKVPDEINVQLMPHFYLNGSETFYIADNNSYNFVSFDIRIDNKGYYNITDIKLMQTTPDSLYQYINVSYTNVSDEDKIISTSTNFKPDTDYYYVLVQGTYLNKNLYGRFGIKLSSNYYKKQTTIQNNNTTTTKTRDTISADSYLLILLVCVSIFIFFIMLIIYISVKKRQ